MFFHLRISNVCPFIKKNSPHFTMLIHLGGYAVTSDPSISFPVTDDPGISL